MGEKSARGRMCDNCLKGHKGRCIVPWCPCICRQPVDHLDSPKVRLYFKERNRVDKIVPRMIVVEDNGEPKRILFKRFMELLEGGEVPLGGGSRGEGLPKLLTIPINKENQMTIRNKRQSGFSLLELLIVVAIILVIAAISVPSLLASRRNSLQAAAVGDIKTVASAMGSYGQEFPYGENTGTSTTWAMATALADLAGAACTGAFSASPTNACLIDSTLAGASVAPGKDGYTFTLAATGAQAWTVLADPLTGNLYGNTKHFCVDQTGIVKYLVGAAITATSAGCTTGTPLGQ